MRRFPVPVLVAAALAVATIAVSPAARASAPTLWPAASSDSIGVRLVDIPADLSDDPRARQYIIDDLKPGTTVHRRIEVANSTASSMHVDLYPDAAGIAHGSFAGAPGRTESDLTTWTTLEQSSLDVPAGSTARDTVTIAIPENAPPGERYGVVWASVSGGQGHGGISMVNRTGVRIYLSVSGDNPPAPSFTVDTMTAERGPDGHAVVLAQVHNTGGRALDLIGTLGLSAVSGALSAGPYQVQLGTTLAPGQSEPVKTVISDQVADGPWKATLELKSGLLAETSQARITFPHETGIGPAVPAHPRPPDRHLALVGALALAALLGLTLVITIVRRRRGGTTPEPEPQPAAS